MAILVRSVFLGMKHAAPPMKRRGSGTIISTASVAGHMTGFATHIYNTAKAAVIHLTRSVAMELGEVGIRVNCITPGGIQTDQVDRTFIQNYAARTPLGRMADKADLWGAVLFLASDASSYVTGHNLVVDGGWTAR